MVENWDRLIEYTSGEWVSFIGDDDYIDPNLAAFISGLLETVPEVDAISWQLMNYIWPEIRPKNSKMSVPAETGIFLQFQEEMLARTFYWNGATDRIQCNCVHHQRL